MSKVIDLGVLVKESLEFVVPNGDKFVIPGNISTIFTMKLSKYQQEIGELEDNEKAINTMKTMVLDILSLDKNQTVDMNYIDTNLDDLRFLKAIIESMMEHIRDISKDPN
ncbi:hypothetical protein EDC18_102424 [Natranaerovirga pectinivora]|uniref:Tail assembly chaperone n=1 Tax=Natranaerovirga pectinivora TaxID=682400 RepID=A0A4R3MN30_9FIRM|nr:hypothetical protein [Natranaerovirga pectinivora]TCT16405.1 hypothetical protein EDC18_102424 [Natranaerovirga pectinivora]